MKTILSNNISKWTLSLKNDVSTHRDSSYLSNHIRFHLHDQFHDIHTTNIPMFEWYIGLNIYLLITRFLDIVYPHWQQKLIGLTAGDASVMTGQFKGVITRVEKYVPHQVYRILGGLHWLDLVMKYGFNDLMDGEVVKMLMKLMDWWRNVGSNWTCMRLLGFVPIWQRDEW